MPLNRPEAQPSLFGAEPVVTPPARKIRTVSQVSRDLQQQLVKDFQSIWISGEIQGCKLSANGHYYFVLKDPDAQLRCVLFRNSSRFIRYKPKDGWMVQARGALELYGPRGDLQFLVDQLEPFGTGSLQAAFEELRDRLSGEGLFAAERKRPLPALPRHIALVTSLGGAVLHDMLQILRRRFPGLHLRIYPVAVQGEGAAEQIAEAIRALSASRWADVAIVARGGGSAEDLQPFNAEAVARAIASSSIPIVSAVGHETDFTICDFVADYRAPTPSVAAEIVICRREELLERIEAVRARLTKAARYRILLAHRALQSQGTDQVVRGISRRIRQSMQRVDEVEARALSIVESGRELLARRFRDLQARLSRCDVRLRLARSEHRHMTLLHRLQRVSLLQRAHDRVNRAGDQLRSLSPLAVLNRGYAVVRTQEGHVLRDASELAEGQELDVLLNRGEVQVEVQEIRTSPPR